VIIKQIAPSQICFSHLPINLLAEASVVDQAFNLFQKSVE